MKSELKNYEFMGIIKPFLPEDVRIKLFEDIKKLFTSRKGEIIDEYIWGKRHLAYKIGEHEEGYYFVLKLALPKDKLKDIEEDLRMTNDLLRYIINKLD